MFLVTGLYRRAAILYIVNEKQFGITKSVFGNNARHDGDTLNHHIQQKLLNLQFPSLFVRHSRRLHILRQTCERVSTM
jgi:hypothetical protein